jgi:hypothetical protein
MKLSVTLKRTTANCRYVMLSALLTLIVSFAAAETVTAPCIKETASDTIYIQKQQVSRKHGIRLYPDAAHQVLFFEAKGVYGKAYQLYIFNVEGKLVKQVTIKNKQTTVLENIEKGDYLFDVFSDDERIENGQMTVR